jgi:hypothetical protein
VSSSAPPFFNQMAQIVHFTPHMGMSNPFTGKLCGAWRRCALRLPNTSVGSSAQENRQTLRNPTFCRFPEVRTLAFYSFGAKTAARSLSKDDTSAGFTSNGEVRPRPARSGKNSSQDSPSCSIHGMVREPTRLLPRNLRDAASERQTATRHWRYPQ